MIVRVAQRGRSFQGAALYYLHDKERDTSGRVAFTHVENVATHDPEKALRWMAYSAQAANEAKKAARTPGRRIEKPVWTISLSWSPEETPTREHMVLAGRSWLADRGLSDYQTAMVAHSDEDYAHLHLIVNLVHPTALRVNKKAVSHAKLRSSKWAEKYEREQGRIYCERRVENNLKRDRGEFVKHREPEADFKARITQLYKGADSGRAFRAALKDYGYTLAQGKRIVVIDREGKPHSLTRNIDGVKAEDIRAKLADIALPTLKEGRTDTESEGRSHRTKRRGAPEASASRDQAEGDSGERTADTGTAAGKEEDRQQLRSDLLNELQDRHLSARGTLYERETEGELLLAEQLRQQYGGDEKRLRSSVAALKDALSRGPIERLRRKLAGQLSRTAKQDLENARRTLASLEERKAEEIGAFNAQRAEARAALEAAFGRERKEIERRFEPANLDPGAQHDRSRPVEQALPSTPDHTTESGAPGEQPSPAPPTNNRREYFRRTARVEQGDLEAPDPPERQATLREQQKNRGPDRGR